MMKRSYLFVLLLVCAIVGHAQVVTENALSPQEYVEQVLVGEGVQVFNVTYNGATNVPGGQPGIGSFTSNNTLLPIEAGLVLSTGSVTSIPNSGGWGGGSGAGSDPDLVQLSGQNINDRSVLEFDFIPTGDSVHFNYVFASEEYTSFTCTQYNDAFGFFISGPGLNGPFSNNSMNLAVVPDTDIPISINTINNGIDDDGQNYCYNADPNWQQNSVYYINNTAEDDFIFNGLTVTLTASAQVICGETYHIKLAIGDGYDSSLDSGVFLEGGSFTSTGQVIPELTGGVGMEGNTMTEGCGPVEMIFTRLGDPSEEITVDLVISGSATPLEDYSPAFPTELYFAAGETEISMLLDVPVDPDGDEDIVIDIFQLVACAGQEVQTTFTFNITQPEPLTLDSYDINGVCGETHLLDPQVEGGLGEYQYQWSTGETTPTIEVSPGVTTTYTLTVSDACEVESQTVDYTVTLPVYLPLEITMGPDVAIDCLEEGTIEVDMVTGGDGDYTYEWFLGGSTVGSGQQVDDIPPSDPPVWYVVEVTDGCGSTAQDSLQVSTVPLDPIEISTTGDVTVICAGDSTTMGITGTTGGTGVYTYEWMDQTNVPVSSSTSHQVQVNADHTYVITATDQCGNEGSTTITTFLPVYAPFTLDLPNDRIICAGDSTGLFASVTGGSGYYTLDWHDLDHADPWYMASPEYDTQYTVTAVDQCGEVLTDEMIVRVEHITIDIVETNRGMDDWYLQAATTPYAQTWIWDMGDGTRYRGPEVNHSYLDLEDHWVTLSITTPNGCEAVDSLLLSSPAQIYFPNAFTPDGDGHNDLFGPVALLEYIDVFELEIFDRWGHRIFHSDAVDKQWDGTAGGEKVPLGVYVYKYHVEGHYLPAREGYGQVTVLPGTLEN